MTDPEQSLIEDLRQEEYVGENRCWPCTVVNIAIGALLALAGGAIARRVGGENSGRLVTIVLGVVFGAAISLRGYLVPGTPTLTKQYLPEPVLQLFGKSPGTDTDDLAFSEQIEERVETDTVQSSDDADQDATESTASATDAVEPEDTDADADEETTGETGTTDEDTEVDAESTTEQPDDEAGEPDWETVEKVQYRRENSVDPEQFLAEIGAVEPCEDRDDVCLSDEFAAEVDEHLEAYEDRDDVDFDRLAELFDVDPEEIEPQDRAYPTYKIGFRIRKWPTDGALFVDIATHNALRERTDDWMAVPLEQRVNILESLRSFLTECPSCDGELRFSQTAVESCCGAHEVIAYKCMDCEQHLVELTPQKIGNDKTIEA